MAQTASYASPSAARPSRPPPSWRSPKSKPIFLLWRGLAARVRDSGALLDVEQMLAPYHGADDYALLDVVTKAAMTPASTVTSGWAQELVGVVIAQFGSALSPSVFGQLRAASLALTSPQGGLLRVPMRSATPKINGSFVGEGQPAPVRRFGLTNATMLPHKMLVLSEFSRELSKYSPLDIEAILENEIIADTNTALDSVLIDATAGDAIRPAGLRAGVAGLTPTASGTPTEKLVADVKQLVGGVQPANRVALIANPVQAASLRSIYAADALTVIASSSVAVGLVLAVSLDDFASASGMPEFSVSEEAQIHEEDTNPLALATVGSPNVVAAPSRSFFQTNVIGVRMLLDCTWIMRRSAAVSWMTGVTW